MTSGFNILHLIMSAMHQQRKNNVERLVELVLSVYDNETTDGQRHMFKTAVVGVSRGYSVRQQREIIEEFENAIKIDEARNE